MKSDLYHLFSWGALSRGASGKNWCSKSVIAGSIPDTHILPMSQDTVFDGEEDFGLEKSENQEQQEEERRLPPLASNGDINLWVDEDKNGDVFLRIDAPFLSSEPVFFNDAAKPVMNKFVEQWREQRDGGGA